MKKLIFFVVFVCLSAFVHAQSSQSLGLKFSYVSHNTYIDPIGWNEWSKSPELGFVYNFFITEKHGIVSSVNINKVTESFDNLIFATPLPISTIKLVNYHASLSLHYIFKHQQWFVKGGLNGTLNNLANYSYFDGELSQRTILDENAIRFIPEIHLGIGRDFDLGKINIRVNGFAEKGFLNGNYFQYGGTVGLFYEFTDLK